MLILFKKFIHFFYIISIAFLTSCSNDPKISGYRELFVPSSSELCIDKSLSCRTMDLPRCQTNLEFLQKNNSSSHTCTHQCFNIQQAKRLWRVFVGREAYETEKLLSNLVVYKGMILGGTPGGRVFAVDSKTHKVVWRTALARHIDDIAKIGGIAITSQGDVVVTVATGDVVLLETQTGNIKKKKNLGCTLRSAPTISENLILVQGSNNALFILDSQLNSCWDCYEAPENVVFLGNASPAFDKNLVFAAYSTGEYKAYDIHSGNEIWFDFMTPQFQDDTVGNLLHVYASPVINDDYIFILGHGGRLVANHSISGNRIWNVNFSGLHTPAVIGNWLFAIDNEGYVFCFEKNTGHVRWSTSLPENIEKKKPASWTDPLIAGESVIFVTEDGDIVFLNTQNGHISRIIRSDIRKPSAAIVVNKILYVLSSQGYLYAFG